MTTEGIAAVLTAISLILGQVAIIVGIFKGNATRAAIAAKGDATAAKVDEVHAAVVPGDK